MKHEMVRLVSRQLDGCATPEEQTRMAELLEGSEQARKIYRETIAQEILLQPEFVERTAQHQRVNGWFRPSIWNVPVAALIVIGLALMILWQLHPHQQDPQDAVAYVRSESSPAPKLLKTGSHKIREDVLIDFFSGAQVRVYAPASFDIRDAMHLHVEHGQLAANINPVARNFRITSERSAFVDLGTEFAVNVGKHSPSELMVYQGEVIANTFNRTGTTERVELVQEQHAIRYNQEFNRFETLESGQTSFQSFRNTPSAPLEKLRAYQQNVDHSKPSFWWTFDRDLHARNGSPVWLVKGNHIQRQVSQENGAIYFSPDGQFHEMVASDEIEFSQNQPFTIELLFCPDRISRASVFSLFNKDTVKANGSAEHFILIETMAQPDFFSHLPACLRTVYRPVAGSNVEYGINAFTDTHYAPGTWVHYAVTFDGQQLRTYQNGTMQNQIHIAESEKSPSSRYALVLGQMASYSGSEPPDQNYRPFVGLIDEVAIYRRALSPREIANHVESLAPPVPY